MVKLKLLTSGVVKNLLMKKMVSSFNYIKLNLKGNPFSLQLIAFKIRALAVKTTLKVCALPSCFILTNRKSLGKECRI